MEIDIRKENGGKVDKIIFSDGEYLARDPEDILLIYTNQGVMNIEVWPKDIDNLIKALQKSKEVWYS